MRYLIAGVVTALTFASASAQGAYRPEPQGGWSSPQAWAPPSRRLHESQSECGPDRGEPVWGPGNALLGYACESEGANGS